MLKARTLLLLTLLLPFCLQAQWVDFTDGTTQWLNTGTDEEEKDIAIGDLDQDGFTDIIVARKLPFSNMGAEPDLLLMNTGDSLVDRTALYAPEFLTNPTDARDVLIYDLDGDGWLDVVFCNTFEDQPDYYRNLGNDMNGDWLGLVDESSLRFPQPLDLDPLQFCAVWAGDVTGDGAPDLYFSNYNPSGGCEDILLINDGDGHFTDETDARIGNLRNSAFGTSVEIHDMDNDGDQDIVKISTLYAVPPFMDNGVYVLFNEGDGTFTNWMMVPSQAPYMFTVADFNRDGMLDIYVVDDNQDYINYAVGAMPDQSILYDQVTVVDPRSTGFGGNCKLADIDLDGDLDLGLCDVDVDIPPCESGNGNRKFTMSRNDADGATFAAPYGTTDYLWNESNFDFAFIDLNNNCYPDLFMGRCAGYEVYINDGNIDQDLVDLGDDQDFCNDAVSTLDAGLGFASYEWSDGSSASTLEVSEAGTYCVTVTNGDGCTEVDCVEYIGVDLPITIVGVTEFCMGETTTLAVTEQYPNYLWNIGGQASSIEVSFGGEICVTVFDDDGCSNTVCETVTMNNTDQVILQEVICQGETYQFGDQTLDTPGSYTETFINQGGCDSTVNLFLMIDMVFPSIDAPAGFCPGESATLTVLETYESYLWENGNTSNSISVTEAGEYCVTVTTENGCEAIVCEIVEAYEDVEQSFDFEICEGAQVEIGGQFFDETGMYEVVMSTINGCDSTILLDLEVFPTYEIDISAAICFGDEFEAGGNVYDQAGQYVIPLETVVGGCDSIITLDLFVSDEITANNVEIVDDFGNASGSISLDIQGGVPPYEYSWSNGANTANITDLTPDTYELVVTDANGCEQTFEFLVDQNLNTQDQGAKKLGISLAPNPFSDQTLVSLNVPNPGALTYRILSTSGQVVCDTHAAAAQFLVGEHLPIGLYFLIIEDQGQLIGMEKLVKVE